ncbi:uncharacterized protein TEOVI_000886300 [Trypanosoma equiperdum]|uniref:Uncharacterized protein n=1 Tax=Trypanosoma equiperdum TaxID=5694 RepID=A0A1G4HYT6_TRYEQ|nr:hypothetical protein, conserved [Trypanosoma equiperdum]
MRTFFSHVMGAWKSKRQLPRAEVDCSDLIKSFPQAPTTAELRQVVHRRLFGSVGPASSEAEALHREMGIRHTVFDLQYRCGASGRCCCCERIEPSDGPHMATSGGHVSDNSKMGPTSTTTSGTSDAASMLSMTIKGSSVCRFPRCFAMRPITKGAEVLAVRLAYEVDDAPTPKIRGLIKLAREERLAAAVHGIQQLVDAEIRLAAGGRVLSSAFQLQHQYSDASATSIGCHVGFNGGGGGDSGYYSYSAGGEACEVSPAALKYGSESAVGGGGVNPLLEEAALREEIVSLYLWRASLLVNMREDERAVSSLLNLAALLAPKSNTRTNHNSDDTKQQPNRDEGQKEEQFRQLQQDRLRLYTSAASWAALNDMEVIYYRSLLKRYEPFPLAETFAHDRPLLLKRVVEACRCDNGGSLNCPNGVNSGSCSYSSVADAETVAYITECIAHTVFAKEVTATVSRAQAAQQHGDLTEDPMRSLCLPFALRYYRFYVGGAFWEHFFRLLCMPPIPPSGRNEEAERLGLTPNYVLDAVGRSMLLHHLVMLHEVREREIADGTVASTIRELHKEQSLAAAASACESNGDMGGCGDSGVPVHPAHYEHVLTDRERAVAVTRLRELLIVGRGYESVLSGKGANNNDTGSSGNSAGGNNGDGDGGSNNNKTSV